MSIELLKSPGEAEKARKIEELQNRAMEVHERQIEFNEKNLANQEKLQSVLASKRDVRINFKDEVKNPVLFIVFTDVDLVNIDDGFYTVFMLNEGKILRYPVCDIKSIEETLKNNSQP